MKTVLALIPRFFANISAAAFWIPLSADLQSTVVQMCFLENSLFGHDNTTWMVIVAISNIRIGFEIIMIEISEVLLLSTSNFRLTRIANTWSIYTKNANRWLVYLLNLSRMFATHLSNISKKCKNISEKHCYQFFVGSKWVIILRLFSQIKNLLMNWNENKFRFQNNCHESGNTNRSALPIKLIKKLYLRVSRNLPYLIIYKIIEITGISKTKAENFFLFFSFLMPTDCYCSYESPKSQTEIWKKYFYKMLIKREINAQTRQGWQHIVHSHYYFIISVYLFL